MRPGEASHEEQHAEPPQLNTGPAEVVDSPAGPSHGDDEEESLSSEDDTYISVYSSCTLFL